LWAKDMAAKDIHKEMLPTYSEHCLSRQAVHNWVQKFSEERTSLKTNNESIGLRSHSNHKNFTPQVSRDLRNGVKIV